MAKREVYLREQKVNICPIDKNKKKTIYNITCFKFENTIIHHSFLLTKTKWEEMQFCKSWSWYFENKDEAIIYFNNLSKN